MKIENGKETAQKWRLFFRRCFDRRISADRVPVMAALLVKEVPLPGNLIFRACLESENLAFVDVDPCVANYTESLLQAKVLQPSQVLLGLLEWQAANSSNNEDSTEGTAENPTPEFLAVAAITEAVIGAVVRLLPIASLVGSVKETRELLQVTQKWIDTLVEESNSNDSADLDDLFNQPPQETLNRRQLVGILAITVLTEVKVSKVLQMGVPKDFGKRLAQSLTPFIAMLSGSFTQLANQLNLLQKAVPSLQPEPSSDIANDPAQQLDIGQIQVNSVQDAQLIWSRAGNFILVDSFLFGKPIASDGLIANYLDTRFQGNVQDFCVHFVTAACDVALVASNSALSTDDTLLYRSFLVNKVPSILAIVQSRVQVFADPIFEMSIRQAMTTVKATGMSSDDIFSHQSETSAVGKFTEELCESFLSSCVLHNILTKESGELMNGKPFAHDIPVKLSRENLFHEYQRNSSKLSDLVSGLTNLDGNLDENAYSLFQIYRSICMTKDTLTLHSLCTKLVNNIKALDALALVFDIGALLGPLCQVLNEWTVDDEHGERQTNYDEFSSCFLLVLVCVHRYDLELADIEPGKTDSFTSKYFRGAFPSYLHGELEDHEQQTINAWIKALFETEGIDNAVLSTCSPRDFFLLVPALLMQSFQASAQGLLDVDTLKNGFELFLEPFLLPALVSGVPSIIDLVWQTPRHTDVFIKLMAKLLPPTSLTGEAAAIHQLVLGMLSQPIAQMLKDLSQRANGHGDVDVLLERSRSISSLSRAARLDAALHFGHDPSLNSLRSQIQYLCYWSQPAAVSTSLPTFVFAHLRHALQGQGATQVMHAISNEVKIQTEAGFAPLAIDVSSALVIATQLRDQVAAMTAAASSTTSLAAATATTTSVGYLGLADALQVEFASAAKTILTEPGRAEAVVRLLRATTAQSLRVPPPSLPPMATAGGDAADGAAAAAGVDDAAAAAAVMGLAAPDGNGSGPTQLDFGTTSADLELELGGAVGQDSTGGGTAGEAEAAATGMEGLEGMEEMEMDGIDVFGDFKELMDFSMFND